MFSIPPTPENVSSWRDLADQLTPEQITELEESERRYRAYAVTEPSWCTWIPRTEADIASTLLEFARARVADTLNDVLIGEVALPAGASPDVWQNYVPSRPSNAVLPYRVLLGEARGIPGLDVVSVQASAIQFSDGRIDDGSVHEPPHVYLRDEALSTAQARELATVLVEAADQADRWAAE
jgi:hypothetical protein